MTGIDVDETVLSSFADNFECKVESWPMKYLDMPLGGNLRAISFRDPIIGWKISYLFGG